MDQGVDLLQRKPAEPEVMGSNPIGPANSTWLIRSPIPNNGSLNLAYAGVQNGFTLDLPETLAPQDEY